MTRIAKIALGALLLAGGTAVTTAPADAHVSFGISVGVPGYYGPPPGYYGRPDPYCDPYGPYYDPYDCDDYGPPGYWDEPVFYDGIWFNGPLRWRWYGGHREFWVMAAGMAMNGMAVRARIPWRRQLARRRQLAWRQQLARWRRRSLAWRRRRPLASLSVALSSRVRRTLRDCGSGGFWSPEPLRLPRHRPIFRRCST